MSKRNPEALDEESNPRPTEILETCVGPCEQVPECLESRLSEHHLPIKKEKKQR